MRKLLTIFIVFIIFLSCKFEKKIKINYSKKNCTEKVIEATYIDKYLKESDTCNKHQNEYFSKYYNNKNKFMEGYSDRFSKQGLWRFFDKKGDTITKAIFKDSELTGLTRFKELDTISWIVFNLPKKGFRISKPKKWIVIEDNGKYTFSDDNTKEFPNIILDIQMNLVEDIEGNVEDLYNSTLLEKKNSQKIENLQFKKLDIEMFDEAYEISNTENIEGRIYSVNEIIYVYKGRIYLLQFYTNNNASYDYNVVKEIIKNSFKVYKTL